MYQASLFSKSADLSFQPPQTFWDDVISGKIANQIKEAAFKKTLSSSEAVYNTMKPIFAQEDDVERMYGIYVTRKNHVISINLIARGSIAGASVYPREIVKQMLAHKACGLVLSHNHPSGDPAPSPEDNAITKHIMIALHCIGANLLDHVIVGANGRSYSFAENGVIVTMKQSIESLFQSNL